MKKLFLCLALSLLIPITGYAQTATFTTQTTTVTPTNLVLHGDVNNDGFEDMVGVDNNTLQITLSNGDGTYRAPVTYPLKNAGDYPSVLGDFNNDGKLDLIVGDDYADQYGNTGFYVYLGNGDGTFAAPTFNVLSGQLISIKAADVNHDGKSDLLIDSSQSGGYNVQVWFGNGDGTFTPSQTTTNTNAGAGILVGDFNGDGKVDFAATNGSEGYSYLGIFIGDGAGNFTQTYSDSSGYNVLDVAADVNGDGRTDIIGSTAIYSTNAVMQQPLLYVYYGNADGSMTQTQISTQNCGTGYVSVADFNGDGIPDIASVETGCTYATASTTTVDILSGKGNNQFGPDTPIYTPSDFTYSLTLLRGNRDTKPDLVLAQSSTNTGNPNLLTTFFNNSSGNFPTCNAPNAATGIAVCSPQPSSTVSSPVNFAIGAAGPIAMRKVEVWVDGSKVAEQLKDAFSNYSFLDASVSLAGGSHAVTVYAAGVDNSLQSKTFTLNVGSTSSCSAPTAPGVNVCSPANGSSEASPVNVQAASTVTGTLARMEVWVDGVKKYTSTTSNLGTSLTMAAGSHRFDFYAVNTAGQKWETTVYSTVNATANSGQTTCSAPGSAGVNVCSPVNGSTVSSPVTAQAASTVTGTIARMEVWVDGVKDYTSTTTSLNTSIPLAAGSHRFDFYAVNTAGQKWEETTYATVQ